MQLVPRHPVDHSGRRIGAQLNSSQQRAFNPRARYLKITSRGLLSFSGFFVGIALFSVLMGCEGNTPRVVAARPPATPVREIATPDQRESKLQPEITLVPAVAPPIAEPITLANPTPIPEPAEKSAPRRPPTRYELATHDDLMYARLLDPFVASDPKTWNWVTEFVKTTGEWSAALRDGHHILQATREGLPIEGQAPLVKIETLVQECAAILGVKAPRTVVRNDHRQDVYVVRVGEETLLVITSGMLNLLENTPEELRFYVGRELGRIRLGHLRLREATFGLIFLLQKLETRGIPAEAQGILPTLAVGRFLTWSREAEISADRAGLMCVSSPKVADAALLRLTHGLQAQSPWLDPLNSQFDVERVLQTFEKWEQVPVVKCLEYLKMQRLQSPYVVERIAALRSFSRSDHYEKLMKGPPAGAPQYVAVLEEVELLGLAEVGGGAYPYVTLARDDDLVPFSTLGTAKYGNTATWTRIDRSLPEVDGQPLFGEIFNDGTLFDEFLGGFVIFPSGADLPSGSDRVTYTTRIQWDWKDRKTISRAGVVNVKIRFAVKPPTK